MNSAGQVTLVLLRDSPAVFVADDVERTASYVRATGRFRRRYGTPETPTYSWGDPCTRTWPWHRIHEIREDADAGE